jgi:hypothetical protein
MMEMELIIAPDLHDAWISADQHQAADLMT